MQSPNQVLARVVVDAAGQHLGDRLFSYVVPEHLSGLVKVGTQVMVPFGRMEPLNACVITVGTGTADGADIPEVRLKEILDVVDSRQLFDRNYLEFLQAVADYYLAPLAMVISAALPPKLNMRAMRVVELSSVESAERITTGESTRILSALLQARKYRLSLRSLRIKSGLSAQSFYRALSVLKAAGQVNVFSQMDAPASARTVKNAVWTGTPPRTPRQENIVAQLKRAGGELQLSALLEGAGTTRGTIARMEKDRIVTVVEREVVRDPLTQYGLASVSVLPGNSSAMPELTVHQKSVYAVLEKELCNTLTSGAARGTANGTTSGLVSGTTSAATHGGHIEAEAFQPWLIHGVTGSGKTEIYLRLIARALELGKSALLMVPEISLTPQLANRLQERFGGLVSVWHSGLSDGERYDTWCRLKNGQIRVLLGARSAVFADMPELGLIVLDEEHDSSYKQSSPAPRYNARHVAVEKAKRCSAMVVLGSATPDMVSIYNARKFDRVLSLPDRIGEHAMPDIQIVDMREEFKQGHQDPFSRRLTEEISACLDRQQQAILLMNRRGFAQHVYCKACGHVVKCRHCSVSLVLHQRANHRYLACHHCGYQTTFIPTCPKCKERHLEAYGLGTQRVEQDLHKLFPTARILRLDSDVVAKKGAYHAVFRQFTSGQADILVGTQMVAKGLDIPKVTLVGVLAADAAFNLPDYRCCERGFQLLTQVAGRAGRSRWPGIVILQTYSTELPALKLAKEHDYQRFAEGELLSRKELEYPPYSQLIRVVVSGRELIEVQAFCEELAENLSKYLEEEAAGDIKILGPAPCLLERVRGDYRYHLLVKNMMGEVGRKLTAAFLQIWCVKPGLSMAVDVDAVDLL